MSSASSLATEVAVIRPRRAVIDNAWRRIGPGVEVLSTADGAPLRRTVKRILDPLVLRLRAHPHLSAPVLHAESVWQVEALIARYATELRATALWFAHLKKKRRQLRITTGNAQDMYFPVCFELAVTRGAPPADADVESILLGLHRDRDRTTTSALEAYLSDPSVVQALSLQLEHSWRDVRAPTAMTEPFLAGLSTVLATAADHRARSARQRVWTALIADETPFNLGVRVREPHADVPWSLVDIGLGSVAPQRPPLVDGVTTGRRPLDRTVADRVRATLRRDLDHDELPDIPLLCAEEVDRACAPWGLLGEDRQATVIAGIEIATDLAPLDEKHTPRYHLAAAIQARLRKEAYVLHARRCLADGRPIHLRQQQVVDDLRDFRRPYLSRLWARLHGRDVWQEGCGDVDDVRTLLDGVARSASLDQRGRIKSMLETLPVYASATTP